MADDVTDADVESLYLKLKKDAEAFGYRLGPDDEFVKDLVRGLLTNEKRYGYQACPCRLASGKKSEDRDMICPCDYRDPDLNAYGQCYCGLYVSEEISSGRKKPGSIPESRPRPEERLPAEVPARENPATGLTVWKCKVCGYLCAREQAPDICPICKAKKERFERFYLEAVSAEEPPLWFCRVCGYLCARKEPPDLCPICKVGRERFARLHFNR